MSVREEELEGSRETARLKREAREARLRRAVERVSKGDPLSLVAQLLRLDRKDVRKALTQRVDSPPA